LLGNETQLPISGSHLDLINCSSFDDDAYVKARFVIRTLFSQYITDRIQSLKILLGIVSAQAIDTSEPTCLELVLVRPLPPCCPVCSSLQLDASQVSRTAALEYRVPRNAWMNGEIGLWSRRCGLARLVDWLSLAPRARREYFFGSPLRKENVNHRVLGIERLKGIQPGVCLMNRPVSAVEMHSRLRGVRKRRGVLSAELGKRISSTFAFKYLITMNRSPPQHSFS
jgi:hypothetical protein